MRSVQDPVSDSPRLEKIMSGPASAEAPATLERVPGAILLRLKKGDKIYCQDDAADAVYCVQEGVVVFSVVSGAGREALLALLGPGSYFGDRRLAGMRHRVGTAVALTAGLVWRIERSAFLRYLAAHPLAMESYIAQLVGRNLEYEADLCGHLLDTSEERLLRLLVKLSALGLRTGESVELPFKLTHEMMAQMIGTTRSRVTSFLNAFRKAGLVEYGPPLVIRIPALMARASDLPSLPFVSTI